MKIILVLVFCTFSRPTFSYTLNQKEFLSFLYAKSAIETPELQNIPIKIEGSSKKISKDYKKLRDILEKEEIKSFRIIKGPDFAIFIRALRETQKQITNNSGIGKAIKFLGYFLSIKTDFLMSDLDDVVFKVSNFNLSDKQSLIDHDSILGEIPSDFCNRAESISQGNSLTYSCNANFFIPTIDWIEGRKSLYSLRWIIHQWKFYSFFGPNLQGFFENRFGFPRTKFGIRAFVFYRKYSNSPEIFLFLTSPKKTN